MKRVFRFFVFVLLVGGWTLAASSLYLIRTADKKFVLIPKDRLGFHDTFVDTRKWTMENVRQHPAVIARMLEMNKSELLSNVVEANHGTAIQQLRDAVDHPVPTVTTPPSEAEKLENQIKSQMHAATQGVTSIVEVN